MSRYLLIGVMCLISSITLSSERYEDTYNLGMKEYISHDYSQAVIHFSESFNLNPNSLTAYYLAQSYHQINDYKESSYFAHMALFDLKPALTKKLRQNLYSLIPRDKALEIKTNEEYRNRSYSYTFSKSSSTPKDLIKQKAIKEEQNRRKQTLSELLKSHEIDSNPDILNLINQ